MWFKHRLFTQRSFSCQEKNAFSYQTSRTTAQQVAVSEKSALLRKRLKQRYKWRVFIKFPFKSMTGIFFSSQHSIISCIQEKILTLMLCDTELVQQRDLISSALPVHLSSIMRGSHTAINNNSNHLSVNPTLV